MPVFCGVPTPLTETELAAVLKAAHADPYQFGSIVLLCIYTGQRRSEIGQLKWEYIDETTRVISLPKSLTKNKMDHSIPYGELTARVLAQLPRTSPYLFPGRLDPNKPFNGWARGKTMLDELTNPPLAQWQLHDLRRSLSTYWAALGTQQVVTEKYINHVSGGAQSPISRVYNRHAYFDEMKTAIGLWEAKINSLSLPRA